MELIDTAVVVAEITKLKERFVNKRDDFEKGYHSSLNELGDVIDSLGVKEVDLENEYMVDRETAREKSILNETRVEYFATGKHTIAAYSEDNLRNQFDAGADWMKKQIIKLFKEK